MLTLQIASEPLPASVLFVPVLRIDRLVRSTSIVWSVNGLTQIGVLIISMCSWVHARHQDFRVTKVEAKPDGIGEWNRSISNVDDTPALIFDDRNDFSVCT